MSVWKRFVKVFDWLLSIGIVLASLGLLVYMFVKDLFSAWLFFALLIFLYIGLKGLIEELRKQN